MSALPPKAGSSGNRAKFTAILRASSFVSSSAKIERPAENDSADERPNKCTEPPAQSRATGVVSCTNATCFVVHDKTSQPLAYIHFEDKSGRLSPINQLTRDEARRIAENIAKLPELLD